jgi:hypothetical protein
MPIVPGDPHQVTSPERHWRNFERGILTPSEFVFAFLDYLGDGDIEEQVMSFPDAMREVVATFLRSIPIDEIPPGLFIPGTGITSDFNRRWQLYRQQKAETVLGILSRRAPEADA